MESELVDEEGDGFLKVLIYLICDMFLVII